MLFVLSDITSFSVKSFDKPWNLMQFYFQGWKVRYFIQFSVPQIEYPLGGSTKKGSNVYFLLQVFWVILLFHQIVLLNDINVVLMSQ